MPNGKPGDHPLSDVLHDLPVYGAEADRLIRVIRRLSSSQEIYAWWDRAIGFTGSEEVALRESRVEHARLITRAKENGWEIPDGAA